MAGSKKTVIRPFIICRCCEQRPARGRLPNGKHWKQCGCEPYPADPCGEKLESLKAEARRLRRQGLLRNQKRAKDGRSNRHDETHGSEPPVNDHELSLSLDIATRH